jgi:hypothetical protein
VDLIASNLKGIPILARIGADDSSVPPWQMRFEPEKERGKRERDGDNQRARNIDGSESNIVQEDGEASC